MLVPRGSLSQVGEALEAAGVIDSAVAFRAAAWLTWLNGRLHAGELAFPEHSTLREVLLVLRTAKPVQHKLTIPEGLTAQQIDTLLAHAEAMTGSVTPAEEGAILPDTYSYAYGTPREALLARAEAAHCHRDNRC